MDRAERRELVSTAGEWESWSPRAALRPAFATETLDGSPALMIAGAENPYCFGWWSRRVPIQPGAAYRFRARLRWEGFTDPNLHLLTAVAWRRGDLARSRCPQDYLSIYRSDDGRIVAEEILRAPEGTTDAELLLVLRYTAGTAWWESLTLEAVAAPAARPVTVAVVQGRPPAAASPEAARTYWAGLLSQAAARLIELAAVASARCHGEGDLHTGNVVVIPDRFQEGIRKPKIQEVVDGFGAEEMVDPEDRILGEN